VYLTVQAVQGGVEGVDGVCTRDGATDVAFGLDVGVGAGLVAGTCVVDPLYVSRRSRVGRPSGRLQLGSDIPWPLP
jgi:hypothetical protein